MSNDSMRIRYGLSPWIAGVSDARRPSYPRLRGEHTARVVIIGGGVVGCATAYACAAAGIRPIVIEADRIGQAASGRGAGLVLPEPGPTFRQVTERHGLRAARKIFTAWRRSSLDGAALLRRLGIKCALDPRRALLVASPGDEKTLRREYEARSAAGLDVAWLNQRQARSATFLEIPAALRLSDAFALDPYRVAIGLAQAAVRRQARIFERSPVTNIRTGKKQIEVLLEGAVVRAETLIVTTGLATQELKPLRRHFKPYDRYFVLTEPVPASVRKQVGGATVMFQDTRTPAHRVHWTREARLLVAGADQEAIVARQREAVLVQRTGQLMYELLTMYPAISGLQPAFGWDARYGMTADGLMYIGPHRNYPRHLFALGGTPDSVTGAFLAARLLTRLVEAEADKGDEVFGWTR